jgi:uridine kinase
MQQVDSPPHLWSIVGQPGAGKSTYADRLAQRLGATVVHQDEFLIDPAKRKGSELTDKYDDPALNVVLDALLSGNTAEFVPFDVQERRRVGWQCLRPTPVIILEGVTILFNPGVRARTQVAIFVDAPPEIRAARQLKRVDQDGWYRDMPRKEIVARVFQKRLTEEPIIERQKAFCEWLLDTAETIPFLLPLRESHQATAVTQADVTESNPVPIAATALNG